MMLESTLNPGALPDRLEALRLRINDEAYLCAAIQRLAFVMSKELVSVRAGDSFAGGNFTGEGGLYERKRRK